MQKNSGFTIIEVVIALAVGAAIIALIISAVGGARRSQRNNARTADISRITTGIAQYIATRNRLPTEVSQFKTWAELDNLAQYVEADINPASSSSSKKGPVFQANGSSAHADGHIGKAASTVIGVDDLSVDEIVLIADAKCDPNLVSYLKGSKRRMAIVFKLEGADETSCIEI